MSSAVASVPGAPVVTVPIVIVGVGASAPAGPVPSLTVNKAKNHRLA